MPRAARSDEGVTTRECVRQGAAVDVFEFAADRHSVGDATDADAARAHQLRQEVRRGFALDGGIRGEDDLAHLPGVEQRRELRLA